eukprot:193054_1
MSTRTFAPDSPISFADLLEVSQDPIEPASLSELRSDVDDTEETSPQNEENNGDKNDELSLSLATRNLYQVSDIDESFLSKTMDSFCRNLKQTVQEQFATSRERLFRQTENEINSMTKVYQDALSNKETELNKLKLDYDKLSEDYNDLNMKYVKLQSSDCETKKKLNCVRQLSQTVMKWKNDCDKKRFIVDYVNNKIIPNKKKMKMQKIYWFWKNKALTQHHSRYDEIWQKRLETLSKKIIEQYEINIKNLRNELNVKTHQLQQLHSERELQQQNMKRAFMRGVSALNLEAMSLFNTKHIADARTVPVHVEPKTKSEIPRKTEM